MRKLTLIALAIVLSACASISSSPTFKDESGALRGYDPVAYFTEQKPVKGSAEFTSMHNNATWYFSSAANKSMFDQSPEKYSPQYGGYCAYGMANGYVVSSDPAAFSLVDGKLYLNYSLGVRETWLEDVPGNIDSADENWIEKNSW
jgi:YHS domain-containing protein